MLKILAGRPLLLVRTLITLLILGGLLEVLKVLAYRP